MNIKVIFAIALIAMLSGSTQAGWVNKVFKAVKEVGKGALTGAVTGAIGGPTGAAIGAATGAATGLINHLLGDAEALMALGALKAQDQASYMKFMDGLEKVDEILIGSEQAADNLAMLDAMVNVVMMQ